MSISASPYTTKVKLKYPDEFWEGPFAPAEGMLSARSPYHGPVLSGTVGQYIGFQQDEK